MLTKNNGSDEHDILQNQFTSFLTIAVSNARIDYLRMRIRRLQRELVTEEYEIPLFRRLRLHRNAFRKRCSSSSYADDQRERALCRLSEDS